MTTVASIDQARAEAFVGKALGDAAGMMSVLMCSIGDRLGLFKNLAEHGPATSPEFAVRAGINERYAREWLSGLACAGYLDYEPSSGRFALPPEHAPVLAQEGGPVFFGGLYEMVPAWVQPIEQVIAAVKNGGGAPQSAYPQGFWDGFERFSGGWFENLLTPVWIPAMPDVEAMLTRGASVADVGCGRGRALIKMAQAYPNSRFTGYDAYQPTIPLAEANARAAGVADRVSFKHLDVAGGLPAQYDLITTFDVVHDSAQPRKLLKSIRQALTLNGRYVCLEINVSDKLEENVGMLGGFFYGASITYCMTSSLAAGGEGLGTAGLPESKLRELCLEAGFGSLERVALENPFNSLYVAKP